MKYETIRWRRSALELIDQRLLPQRLKYIRCTTAEHVFDAIRKMKVRGAPAIGITAAFGVYLGARKSKAKGLSGFIKDMDRTISFLSGARLTARNLFWALERMEKVVTDNKCRTLDDIRGELLKEALKMIDEDNDICRNIGRYGRALIEKSANILTHCNAGGLATASYGTALGVIFSAGKRVNIVYADETRPRLQGARLTVWELKARGIPVNLICDNAASYLMAQGKIDAVIVGADRIAANGDTANKIGTYGLAIAARYHCVPFFVAAPVSTFDVSIGDGSEIEIECRGEEEVTVINGKRITPRGVKVLNPAFDITSAELITAIITERGVIRRPNRRKIMKIVNGR